MGLVVLTALLLTFTLQYSLLWHTTAIKLYST